MSGVMKALERAMVVETIEPNFHDPAPAYRRSSFTALTAVFAKDQVVFLEVRVT